jgi:hypothetical protein
MPQAMPKGTKCTGCSLPIKIEESFVGYRFGVGVQFWHNRSRINEDCWGRFLLERVHLVQTSKNLRKPSLRPPAIT